MSILVEHDLSADEMVRALSWTARAEGIDADLFRQLAKSLSVAPQPEPEEYMRHLVRGLDEAYKVLSGDVADAVDRWLDVRFGMHKSARAPGPYLTQQQVDELVALIRAEFRIGIRASLRLPSPETLELRFRTMGIIAPTTRILRYFDDAYLGGRLYDVLTNNSTYDAMRAASVNMRIGRVLELSMGAVRRQISASLMRFANGIADDVEEALVRLNNERVQEVISQYMVGRLGATPQNRTNLSPEEVARTERPNAIVGWRALGNELRNRMMSVDAGRDWHRVAASQVRYALNMGTLAEMAERRVAFVEWRVMENACEVCRSLFLMPDGTPRRFPMVEVQRILEETGGTNAGRPRSEWLATALPHPWCRCVPRPVRA